MIQHGWENQRSIVWTCINDNRTFPGSKKKKKNGVRQSDFGFIYRNTFSRH